MATELEKTVENTEGKAPETEPKIEEPSAAELAKRIKKLEDENEKLRQANTNASADASKWKKQYQEKLSEEERTKAVEEENAAKLQQELQALRAERNVANHKSELISIGFDDDLATEVATALNDGKTAEIFAGLRKFIAAHDKAQRENAFRNNPTLQGGGATKAVTKEEFDKMGYTERVKVFNEYPDLYKEYTQ